MSSIKIDLTKWESDLAKEKQSIKGQVKVVVGFTANYALWVHENVGANFRVGQAKFLEQPARVEEPQMLSIVGKVLGSGKGMVQALTLAGLFLQRKAQQLTPVDTGNLKASAFTRREL